MKFTVYYPPYERGDFGHIEAWEKILECEGWTLQRAEKTSENSKKCMTMGKGIGLPVLFSEHKGKEDYIGYHYSHLVDYLHREGLMQC